jgi:hypothetical protein
MIHAVTNRDDARPRFAQEKSSEKLKTLQPMREKQRRFNLRKGFPHPPLKEVPPSPWISTKIPTSLLESELF